MKVDNNKVKDGASGGYDIVGGCGGVRGGDEMTESDNDRDENGGGDDIIMVKVIMIYL